MVINWGGARANKGLLLGDEAKKNGAGTEEQIRHSALRQRNR